MSEPTKEPTKAQRVKDARAADKAEKLKAARSKGGRPKGAKDTKPRATRSDKGKPKATPIPEPPPVTLDAEGNPVREPVALSAEAARQATAQLVGMAGEFAARVYGPDWRPTKAEREGIGTALYDCAAAYGWLAQLPPYVPLCFAIGGYAIRALTDAEERADKARKVEAAKKKAAGTPAPKPAAATVVGSAPLPNGGGHPMADRFPSADGIPSE